MVQLLDATMMHSCYLRVICYLCFKRSSDHQTLLFYMVIQLILYDIICLHPIEGQCSLLLKNYSTKEWAKFESVEWAFGKVIQYFAFLDFRKNQKVLLQPIGKYYAVGVLLINCHSCLYGSVTASYFCIPPPDLHTYLSGWILLLSKNIMQCSTLPPPLPPGEASQTPRSWYMMYLQIILFNIITVFPNQYMYFCQMCFIEAKRLHMLIE